MPPVRVVYDAMVFLQAAVRETGPAFACLQLADGKVVELLICPSLLAEVRDVLGRPEICSKLRDGSTVGGESI